VPVCHSKRDKSMENEGMRLIAFGQGVIFSS
jgi:hypothetical protein